MRRSSRALRSFQSRTNSGPVGFARECLPARIDAVENAGQLPAFAARPQQAVKPAAMLPRRDFPRVGLADRRHLRGVIDAGFQERNAAVEFDAVDRHRLLGNGERAEPVAFEQSLIGEIVNCQYRGDVEPLPLHVGRRQGRRPIVGVHDIRPPVRIRVAFGDFRGGERKPGEADVVVTEIDAGRRRRASRLDRRARRR